MKLSIVHDKDGNVISMGVPGPEFANETDLEAGEGTVVSEIDSSEIGIKDDLLLDMENEKSREAVRRALESAKGKLKTRFQGKK